MAPAPPSQLPRCLGLLAGGAPTRQDARFYMSRANASKSGMGMWPGAYSLKWSSDASLVDIVCGGGGGREGVVCCVVHVKCDVMFVVRDRLRAVRVSSPRSKNSHSVLRQACGP